MRDWLSNATEKIERQLNMRPADEADDSAGGARTCQ